MRDLSYFGAVRISSALIPVLSIAALLAVPTAAQGAVDIGYLDLEGAPSSSQDSCTAPCVAIQDQLDGRFVETPEGNWVITEWSVRNAAGTIALRVLRPTSFETGELHASDVNESADETGGGDDAVQTFATRQRTQGGDYIGITFGDAAARIGFLPGDADDTVFAGPGGFGTGGVDDIGADNLEALYRATLERDADSDGYGDETQDGCPSNASTRGACPPPPGGGGGGGSSTPPDPFASVRSKGPSISIANRSARASKRGVVTVLVKNASGLAISGRVALSASTATLSAKRKKVGSKSYRATSGATAKVKLKLSAAARRALRRKRKLKLKVRTTAKAAQGKATVKVTSLTVKPAKKKKKRPARRRRRTGGDQIGPVWLAKNLDRGANGRYGDFQFRLQNGKITVTGTPLVSVLCTEIGGNYGSSISFEPFFASGPWNLGAQDQEIQQQRYALNTLVPGTRTIRYQLKSTRVGNKITGELTIRFSGAKLYFYPENDFATVICTGTDRFEAIPK